MIKKTIKYIIKKIVPRKTIIGIKAFRYNLTRLKQYNKGFSLKDAIYKGKLISASNKISKSERFAIQFKSIIKSIRWIHPHGFIYPYDPKVLRWMNPDVSILASITVDFEEVLNFDIDEFEVRLANCKNQTFRNNELSILESIRILVTRIITSKNTSKENQEVFKRILHGRPSSLYEALQKILFFDALFWQVGHLHIGLGRMDYILYPFFREDLGNNILNREEAKSFIKDFCLTLGSQTGSKSLGIVGDTGQYILLGGVDSEGNNIANDITEIFLEIFSENRFPDPKLILRANNLTPDFIWEKAISSIATGNGSPLIMNEEIIMNKMVNFGYKEEDVWNLGTSACWEPLIIGKSFDQNNPLPSVNLLDPLTRILISNDCPNNFDDLISKYKSEVKNEIHRIAKDINFDCSPLFSLFFKDCILNEKDFSEGGASYNYHGMQAIGLPNVVNALLNIKLKIFENKIIPMEMLKKALLNDFIGFEDVRQILISGSEKFGKNDTVERTITNDIMDFVDDVISGIRINGEKVKIGFSSPNYIIEGKISSASADGRKKDEPLAVHISPTSSEIDLSEIIDFASTLNYKGNRLNGNVVDFIVPQSYVRFPSKLVSILKNAIKKGIFELQLNVLDKNVLIDAKMHPEKYPNLIVRVWGFSAYYKDLPEEYKDNLIQRASIYEAS